MSRRIASVFCLVICLNAVVDLARGAIPGAEISRKSQSSLSDGSQNAAEGTAVSAIMPCQESALLADGEVAGFSTLPTLVTSEPALLQLHSEDVAHLQWRRFGVARLAPFAFCRSLRLQV
jgi:hypothetical protein